MAPRTGWLARRVAGSDEAGRGRSASVERKRKKERWVGAGPRWHGAWWAEGEAGPRRGKQGRGPGWLAERENRRERMKKRREKGEEGDGQYFGVCLNSDFRLAIF